ncbi:DUF397 domain-containing protein [Longispora sp. K20-0274]|uniref:DUF397 domain-containing protein n=1 Tax=Longispora sp. K20-0274 TaxID=3088255 RepID=UPI00399BF554
MKSSQFTAWHKSTRSDVGGCVEVSPSNDHLSVGVRDTKDRSAGMLVFGGTEWQSFVVEVKAGSFAR